MCLMNKKEFKFVLDELSTFSAFIMHDLIDDPLPFLMTTGKKHAIFSVHERLKFSRYLGRNLANRTLHSIYLRFNNLFKTYNKGKFTTEEDNTIILYMNNSNNNRNISQLATILNRTRDSIKKRHEALKSENHERFKTNLEIKKEIIENLMDIMDKNIIEDLSRASIKMKHWKKLESRMNIPAVKLRRHWLTSLYPKLFSVQYDTILEVRENLINLLYDNYKDDRKEIVWSEVALHFDGMTATYLRDLFHNLIWVYVPTSLKYNFKESVNHLKNVYLPKIRSKKYFMKLQYYKGELIELKGNQTDQ